MNRTALYSRHVDLKAKLVPFAGWEMPVQYKGILHEHQTVRLKTGLFDVSHMGRIFVTGQDAERFLDYLSTNTISGKSIGSATYTVFCNEAGGSVDDVMIFKQAQDRFFVVVNASNRDKDLAHLQRYSASFQVQVQDRFKEDGILALQGHLAPTLMGVLIPETKDLKPMRFLEGQDVIISRTGYTGAGGFELFGTHEQVVRWWDTLMQVGQLYGIDPIGLGARDTLRLEAGFALYGHELSDTIAPTESVSDWTVKWNKPDFLGKTALEKLESSGHKRHAYGVRLTGKGIPREKYLVWQREQAIGVVTSGTFSPTLNQGIALILVDTVLKEGDSVEIEIRQQKVQAQVVNIPFIRKKA